MNITDAYKEYYGSVGCIAPNEIEYEEMVYCTLFNDNRILYVTKKLDCGLIIAVDAIKWTSDIYDTTEYVPMTIAGKVLFGCRGYNEN